MSRQLNQRATESATNAPLLNAPGGLDRRVDPFALPASFASQLLASRERMAVHRLEISSPAHLASNAYDKGGRIAVKRMPNGYVRTLVV